MSQSREDVFAGLLSDDFGETISPELLLSVLLQHGYVVEGKKYHGSVSFNVLREFTVYKRAYLPDDPYSLVTRTRLQDSYFRSIVNRHLY
jgi:hypothetical protein